MRIVVLAMMLSGCGSTLWLITPRPEVTYQEVSRTSAVQVTSNPPGATLYVDGAEAGMTPRSVSVAHKELRRQRRQSIWLPLIGTVIDALAFTVLTIAAAEENGPGMALPIAAVGLGVTGLDLYLITGRSVVNEGVDTLPVGTELGVRAPGFHDASRKVRVPDLTRVDFQLVPLAQAAPPPADAPPAAAAPTAPAAP